MNRKTTWRVSRDGEWGPATAQDNAKEAERIRNLAETLDVMNDVYWTHWQALAWIIHHDVDRVRECSEAWRDIGPLFHTEGAPLGPFRKIWREIGVNYDVSKAWVELRRARESGKVRTAGIDAADGKPREIDPLEWLGIEFRGIGLAAELQPYRKGLQWRFEDLDKISPAFRDVRVRVADVLKEFPAETGDSATAPSKPNVSKSDLRDFLKKTATIQHTKPQLRELAGQAFPGRSITKGLFEAAYGALPPNQKRSRGDTGRRLKTRAG
jgi:hypothetical protein